MSCDSRTINITELPSTATSIPGFDFNPSSPKTNVKKQDLPSTQPEDLNELYDALSMILPPGTLKSNYSPNFGKEVIDGLFSLMETFTPFLMLYKFFLPILKIIVCIINVICSLLNPFTMFDKIKDLMENCIPELLALYPPFSMAIMILSILLLVIKFIEYVIAKIEALVKSISTNLDLYKKGFSDGNVDAIIAATKKLSNLMCTFANFFVIFGFIGTIIKVFEEILKLAFGLPCSDDSGCCGPDSCPKFLKDGPFTNQTGTLLYHNTINSSNISSISIPGFGTFSNDVRTQSFQFYDSYAEQFKQFINIINAYDSTSDPKPVFFPSDAVYTPKTQPLAAAYTVDITFTYDPVVWQQTGVKRDITFKQCIVLVTPTAHYSNYNNEAVSIPTGVLTLGGGLGYEIDGMTKIMVGDKQATLETFLVLPPTTNIPSKFDDIFLENVKYTFKPGYESLFSKTLISAGCSPVVAPSKDQLNNVVGPELQVKAAALEAIPFPDMIAAQTAIYNEIDRLSGDLNKTTLAGFKVPAILDQLKKDCLAAIEPLFNIAFDRYNSKFTLSPLVQWTTQTIRVDIDLRDFSNNKIAVSLPTDIINYVISKIKVQNTFGNISSLSYDNVSQTFYGFLSSDEEGSGVAKLSYDFQTFATKVAPTSRTTSFTIVEQSQAYEFIKTAIVDNKIPTDVSDVAIA